MTQQDDVTSHTCHTLARPVELGAVPHELRHCLPDATESRFADEVSVVSVVKQTTVRRSNLDLKTRLPVTWPFLLIGWLFYLLIVG